MSALDLYINELVAEKMLEIFTAVRPPAKAFSKFLVGSATLLRIKTASAASQAEAAFDLEVRERLSRLAFQFPEDIADAIRSVSDVELWKALVVHQGATAKTAIGAAKNAKLQLSAIVQRRNKIVHEGDLQASIPRIPYSISTSDLIIVEDFIKVLVDSIEVVV